MAGDAAWVYPHPLLLLSDKPFGSVKIPEPSAASVLGGIKEQGCNGFTQALNPEKPSRD